MRIKAMSDTKEKLQKELERVNRELKRGLERINRANARMIEFIRSVEWGGKIESERFLKSIEQ